VLLLCVLQYLGAFGSEEAAHQALEERMKEECRKDKEAAEFFLQYICRLPQ
jgi:hypothetical protein